jgi:hypothetical protein
MVEEFKEFNITDPVDYKEINLGKAKFIKDVK